MRTFFSALLKRSCGAPCDLCGETLWEHVLAFTHNLRAWPRVVWAWHEDVFVCSLWMCFVSLVLRGKQVWLTFMGIMWTSSQIVTAQKMQVEQFALSGCLSSHNSTPPLLLSWCLQCVSAVIDKSDQSPRIFKWKELGSNITHNIIWKSFIQHCVIYSILYLFNQPAVLRIVFISSSFAL